MPSSGARPAVRDERRIAVEGDAGGVNRGLAVRRRHHRGVLAGKRAFDRGARRVERGAAVLGMDLADVELAPPDLDDANLFQRQALRLEHVPRSDDERLAQRADPGIERRLERDLRPDAAGVADRDRYFCLLFNNAFRRG